MAKKKPFRTLREPVGPPDQKGNAPAARHRRWAGSGWQRAGIVREKLMTTNRKRWPPVLEPACPPTHFTIEESRRIMREVVEEATIAEEERRRKRLARRALVERRSAA